jgi:SAM-dependent methyltransferase
MGINERGVEFLLATTRPGDRLGTMATLGRQNLHDVSAAALCALAARHHRALSFGDAEDLVAPTFADDLLRWLGADEVCSLDASDFEGATMVVDLNVAVGEGLRRRFDTVLDGGTLEHVFNYPVALANAMDMVRPGGRLIHITPTNQEAGHGFYQLSPEVFFRSLCEENGYRIERALLREETTKGLWREVHDPVALGHRVEFTTSTKAYLYIAARRVAAVPPFSRWPQQSDYASEWEDPGRQAWTVRTPRYRRLVAKLLPDPVAALLRPLRTRRSTGLRPLGLHLDPLRDPEDARRSSLAPGG